MSSPSILDVSGRLDVPARRDRAAEEGGMAAGIEAAMSSGRQFALTEQVTWTAWRQ
jgi:hypothetical protein